MNNMKNLIIALLCAVSLQVSSQDEIVVKIQERPSSKGLQPAFEIEIPQAQADDAIRILESTLSPRKFLGIFKKRQRLVQEKDEWIMQDVEIKNIASEPLSVYAQVTSFPERIFVRLFFEGDQGFVGSAESTVNTERVSQYVRDYGVNVYRNTVEQELKQEEGVLAQLQNDLKKMGRKQSNTDKRISSMRASNVDMERENADLRMRSQRKETVILEGAGAQAMKKQHDQEASQIQKQIRSNERKIRKNSRRISSFERKGNRNLRDQADILNQIDQQKLVIREVESRLRNIR